MRAILVAASLTAVLHPMAHAEPRALADTELGRVSAGLLDSYLIVPVIVVDNRNSSTATAVGSSNISSTAVSDVNVVNVIRLSTADTVTQLPAVTLAAPVAGGNFASGNARAPASPQLPIWVPWAAELRATLGLR